MRIFARLLRRAKADRSDWAEDANLLYRAAYDKRFRFMTRGSARGRHRAQRVTKVREGLQIFCPQVVMQQGERRVSPTDWASPGAAARLKAKESYVNAVTQITDYWAEHRRTVRDCLLFGRGAKWWEVIPEAGVVTNRWTDSRDILLDPNGSTPEEWGWVARVWRLPRWELMRIVRDDRRALARVQSLPSTRNQREAEDGDFDLSLVVDRRENEVDMVEVYDCYFRHGIHRYDGGIGLVRRQMMDAGISSDEARETAVADRLLRVADQPRRYIVTPQGLPLVETDWPIPFYRMPRSPWPLEVFDADTDVGSPWPKSVFEPGLPYLENMAEIMTRMFGRYDFQMRTVLGFRNQGGAQLTPEDLTRFWLGQDVQAIGIKGKSATNVRLDNLMQEFRWDTSWMGASIELYRQQEELFSRAVGLYGIHYAGEADNQIRVAADAQLKGRFATTRLDDVRHQVLKAEGICAAKDAFAAAYLYSEEEVVPIIGPEQSRHWGVLTTQALRDDPMLWAQTYAQDQGVSLEVAMQAHDAVADRLVTLEEIAVQSDWEIAVGSTRRRDPERGRQSALEFLNQPLAALLSNGMTAEGMAGLAAVAEELDWPEQFVASIRDGAAKAQEREQQAQQAQQQAQQQAAQAAELDRITQAKEKDLERRVKKSELAISKYEAITKRIKALLDGQDHDRQRTREEIQAGAAMERLTDGGARAAAVTDRGEQP